MRKWWKVVDLNLRKIRSFVAVAELGSFRRASEALHLSAPALSSQVRELEQALGVPLLHRTTRNVGLTPEGERFLVRARKLMEDINSIVMEFKDEADLVHGRVVVACVPTLVSTLLPQTIAAFKEPYPGIAVQVLDVAAAEMVERVGACEADLGIGPLTENNNDFDFKLLARDPFVAVLSVDHPLANRKKIRLAELTEHPFIGFRTGNSVHAALEKAFTSIGHQLNPVFELQHHYSLGGMVQAGLGITALPSMAVPLLNFPNLTSVPIVDPVVIREIGIIQRKGGGTSPAAAQFLRTLEHTVDSLDGAQRLRRRGAARRTQSSR